MVFKTKRDPPPLVDSNAVTALLSAFERLQAIAGWHPQVVEPGSRVQHIELTSNDRPDRFLGVGGELKTRSAIERPASRAATQLAGR